MVHPVHPLTVTGKVDKKALRDDYADLLCAGDIA
jgi:hypothetical protein